MKTKQTWVVVADGTQARIYLNSGVGKGLTPVPGGDFESPNLPTREINADKPGMTFSSVGSGRRRKQASTDPSRQAKFNFAKQLVTFLEEEHRKIQFDRLILVAAPRTLGDLRAVMPASIHALVDGELAKDLTHIDAQKLPQHLDELLVL